MNVVISWIFLELETFFCKASCSVMLLVSTFHGHQNVT